MQVAQEVDVKPDFFLAPSPDMIFLSVLSDVLAEMRDAGELDEELQGVSGE